MDAALVRELTGDRPAPPLLVPRERSWAQLNRYLPILVTLTAMAAIAEGIAGVAFDEPVLAAAAVLSGAFGGVVVACGLLVHTGRLRRVPVVMAIAVYALGIVGATLLPGVGAGCALLPILAVVLLLPGHGRRMTAGIVVLAILGSALVFVLAGSPHPFPPLREPLRSIFPPAVILGIAILVLATLADFANEAHESLEAMSRTMDRQQLALIERMAVVSSVSKLERGETAHATAAAIVEALAELPGVDVSGIFALTSRGLEVLGLVGPTTFPLQLGDVVPTERANDRLAHVADGPWGELWVPGERLDAYARSMTESGIRGLAYGPILHGKRVIGIVAVGTRDEARADHLVSDLPAVGEFGAIASTLLAPQLAELQELADLRARIESIIALAAFHPVYQAVIDLTLDRTVGYEALTRFDDGRSPDVVFGQATAASLGLALEAVTLAAAVRLARRLPADAWLSLNVSPDLVIEHDRLAAVLAGNTRPILLEITEHVPIADYRAVRDGVAALGPQMRLAVDDAGAGIANFGHIVDLRADVIKIDISLIRDIDTDLRRQALVVGLVHFAATTGSEVVAEGIETAAERATIHALGVRFGQGYLMGRPATIDAIAPIRRDDVSAA